MVKFNSHCGPTLPHEDYDLNSLESTLLNNASTQASPFLAEWFLLN